MKSIIQFSSLEHDQPSRRRARFIARGAACVAVLPLGLSLALAACSSSDSGETTSGAGAANVAGASGSAGAPSTAHGGTAGGDGSGSLGAAGTGGASLGGSGRNMAGSSGAGSGAIGTGGAAGVGGGNSVTGPCDLYEAAKTPCVAAHSTVRALYGAFDGNLYQVRRDSDETTKDVAVLSPGGVANAATQDAFCAGTTCTISIIYDQSPEHNHLTSAPAGGFRKTPDKEADANAAKIQIAGHSAYAVYTEQGIGYRNDKTSGVATGDQAETLYMVTSGKHFNGSCCFDYGNAETDNNDDGAGTMEAIYFGNAAGWGKGAGTGPWVMTDLENGLFTAYTFDVNPKATPVAFDFATALLKGRSGSFAIKSGNATSGELQVNYDGPRPKGYDPMKKQGAIILGIGGDNSNSAVGTFYEGCMTTGDPSDETDDAVQANIVAAGYGK